MDGQVTSTLRCPCTPPGAPGHAPGWDDTDACTRCGRRVRVDEAGVVRLTSDDVPWHGVPGTVVSRTLGSVDADDLVDAIDGSTALQEALLDPSSGVAATVVALPPDARVLDLGTGWYALAGTLATLGARATRADWVYARLRFTRTVHGAAGGPAVHLAVTEPLPWPDGTFDAVFVDLAAIRDAAAADGRPPREARRVASCVLDEARRVVSGTGVLVAGVRSPLRTVADALVPVLRGRAPALQDLRRAVLGPGPRRTLRRARLAPRRAYVSLPSRTDWSQVVPAERLGAVLRATHRSSGAKRLVARALLALGGGSVLAPDAFLVSRPTPSVHGAPPSLPERLAGRPGRPLPITTALSDARVAVLGPEEFLKLPLSPDQAVALPGEVAKTESARSTGFGPFVVAGSRVGRWHGTPYAAYPAVAERSASVQEKQAVLVAALDAVLPGEPAALRSTTFWARLGSERGAQDAEDLGASALRRAVLDAWGDATVPTGPTHGDLHTGNVLVPHEGRALLVDWNRFETRNPLVLDPAYAALQLARESGRTLAEALAALRDGRLHGPLADRADALRGDLTLARTATLVLLDRVVSYSLPRRRHKPWTMPALREAVATLRDGADAPASD